MASLYLFSLIVGGGLLLFTLFGGSGADDAGGELHGDHHFDAELSGTMAHEFFSVRAVFYFLAGFGATGFLLESLTDASGAVAAVWAVATGLIAATAATLVYGWLRRSESGMVPMDHDHLAGLPARVLLPVRPGLRGKVVAEVGGREVELLARLYGSADPACPRGTTVVIVEVDGDTALVTPASFLPSETQ